MRKLVKRLAAFLGALVVVFLIFLYATTSGFNLRRMLAGSILSSQHPQFAKLLLSQAQVDELQKVVYEPPSERSAPEQITPVKKSEPLHIETHTVDDPNFTAKILTVNDPTTIHLVSSKHSGQGQPLSALIEQNKGIAGINAGGFKDPSGMGTGGEIIGVAISDGKPTAEKGANFDSPSLVCGFTDQGRSSPGPTH